MPTDSQPTDNSALPALFHIVGLVSEDVGGFEASAYRRASFGEFREADHVQDLSGIELEVIVSKLMAAKAE